MSAYQLAYKAAEARYPAAFSEPQVNIDKRWAYHARLMMRLASQLGDKHGD